MFLGTDWNGPFHLLSPSCFPIGTSIIQSKMDSRDRTDDLDFLLNSVVRATTNLRDENARLKAENERLERVLSEALPVSHFLPLK